MPKVVILRGQSIDIGLTQEDVETIKARTPIRKTDLNRLPAPGNLQKSWILDDDGEIKNDAYYAEWVELGTGRFPGRFMAFKSLQKIGERLERRVAKRLDEIKLLDLKKVSI